MGQVLFGLFFALGIESVVGIHSHFFHSDAVGHGLETATGFHSKDLLVVDIDALPAQFENCLGQLRCDLGRALNVSDETHVPTTGLDVAAQ